jgi:hypothetical protein
MDSKEWLSHDFQKLLASRAHNRIMLFYRKSNITETLDGLEAQIKKYKGSLPGDRYLLIGIDDNNAIPRLHVVK